MRRLALAASIALAIAAPGAALAQYAGPPVAVQIDQSLRVGFAGRARDVVVGNPMIADVFLMESGGAVITGKEYGITNITAFDANGRTVFARQVVVMAGDENRVAYLRGPELNNYVCAYRCERTPMPGEAKSAYDDKASAFAGYAERQKPPAAAGMGAGTP